MYVYMYSVYVHCEYVLMKEGDREREGGREREREGGREEEGEIVTIKINVKLSIILSRVQQQVVCGHN